MAYKTSERYNEVIYSQDTRNRIRIWFNEVELEDADIYCEKLTVSSRILPNGSQTFSLNNLTSQELTLVLHDLDIETIKDQVKISLGTMIEEDIYEDIPLGVYNIQDSPITDKNKITIKLRDNSIKLDFNYNGKDLIELNGGSATKLQILNDICEKAGIKTKVQWFEGCEEKVGIYDSTISGRVYVKRLAEASGYVPIIDRDGDLDFVLIKADKLTTSGSPLQLANSIGKPLLSLNVEGNSKQETRSGDNLLPNQAESQTINGITFTVYKDGSVLINGTATSRANLFLLSKSVPLKADTYTLNSNKNSGNAYLQLEIKKSDGTYIYLASTNEPKNFEIDDDRDISNAYISVNAGDTVNNEVIKPMLNLGTTALEYEQYGASPSPDYPSEVEDVEGIRNLYNINNVAVKYDEITFDEDGWVTCTYDNSSSANVKYSNFWTYSLDLKPSTNYNIIAEIKSVSGTGTFVLVNSNGTQGQFKTGKSYAFSDLSNNTILTKVATTYDDLSNRSYGLRTFIQFNAGQKGSITFRLSVLENTSITPSDFVYFSYDKNNLGLKITNKNIFNGTEWKLARSSSGNLIVDSSVNNITIQNYDSNNVSFTKTSTAWWSGVTSNSIKLKANQKYIISFAISFAGEKDVVCLVSSYDGVSYKTINEQYLSSGNNYYYEYTPTEDIEISVGTITQNGYTYSNIMMKNIMIITQQKITYLDLKGNFIGKLNDIKDELSIVGNKAILKKNIKRYYFTGDENPSYRVENTNTMRFDFNFFNDSKDIDGNKIMCNMFTSIYANSRDIEHIRNLNKNYYNVISIHINKSRLEDVTDDTTQVASIKKWLKELYDNGTPLYIDYILAEPYEVDLGTIDIETFEGVNNIFLLSSLDTNMSCEYYNKKQPINIPIEIVEKYSNGEEYKIGYVEFEDAIRHFDAGSKEDGDNLFINSDNPYISKQEDIDNIYKNTKDFKINSFKTGKILGNPSIDPWDLIEIVDGDKTFTTLATNNLTYNGVYIQTFDTQITKEARKENVSVRSEPTFKKWAKTTIDNIEANVEINTGKVKTIEATQTDNYNEIINKFNDYTPSSKTLEIENSVKTLQTDTYTKTEINTKLTDGSVTKVMTTSGTFDENGMTYEKTNAPTKTTINEVGVNVKASNSYNDNSLLFAGYVDENNEQYSDYKGQTIVATDNIIVTHYLVVGSHTRIEDFVDEEGNECTAEFFLD